MYSLVLIKDTCTDACPMYTYSHACVQQLKLYLGLGTELKDLAESLPSIVLRSRAASTVKKYSGAFSRWKRWAKSKPSLEVIPAKPFQVALYLNFLTRNARSSAPVEEAVNALSWAHQLAVVEDPTQHSLVRQVLAGAKRILANRTEKKEPITAEILHKLYNKFVTI